MMTKIKNIKAGTNHFIMNELLCSYIFCCIFNFFESKSISYNETDLIKIDKTLLGDLKKQLEVLLFELLNVSYTEPSIKKVQKHSSRYERIVLNEKVYKLNYRMSVSDRLAYSIFMLIDFIKAAENEKVNIEIEVE